jgi:hypothetical protein
MKLTLKEILDLIGLDKKDINQHCIDFFDSCDFSYEIISNTSDEFFKIVKFLDSDNRRIGKDNLLIWEKSWERNLESLDTTAKHFGSKFTFYLDEKFIRFSDINAELNFNRFLSICLFTKYFEGTDNIYEFGSGSGFNLITLSDIFPDKKLFGLDFSKNAIKIVNKVSEMNKLNIESLYFDIINPDNSLKLKTNSAVFTMFSLEQVSNKFYDFILFLLKRKPKICIHIEPIVELLDENIFSDYLSKKFHIQRNYLNRFLPFLQALEINGLIEIIKLKRIKMKRSNNTECVNYIVWKVK